MPDKKIASQRFTVAEMMTELETRTAYFKAEADKRRAYLDVLPGCVNRVRLLQDLAVLEGVAGELADLQRMITGVDC